MRCKVCSVISRNMSRRNDNNLEPQLCRDCLRLFDLEIYYLVPPMETSRFTKVK